MWLSGIIAVFIIRMYYLPDLYLQAADFLYRGTADFLDDYPRAGVRVTSIGERPYCDPSTLE